MTQKETVDSILRLLTIIFSWPVVFIVFVTIFYKDIRAPFPNLLRRLRQALGGWQFDEWQEVKEEVAELFNQSEIRSDRLNITLTIDPKEVQLTHSSTPVDEKYWRVRVWLIAPEDFMDIVGKVVYERNAAFKNRFKEVASSPFADSFRCWGAITIRAEIHLRGGQVLKRQCFLSLEVENEDNV